MASFVLVHRASFNYTSVLALCAIMSLNIPHTGRHAKPHTPKTDEEKSNIDADAVRELSALLKETGLAEIEIEHNGARIRVSRAVTGMAVAAPAAAAPAP